MKKTAGIVLIALCALTILCGCKSKKNDDNTPTSPLATAPSVSKNIGDNNGTVTDKDGFIGNDDGESKNTSPMATILDDMNGGDSRRGIF